MCACRPVPQETKQLQSHAVQSFLSKPSPLLWFLLAFVLLIDGKGGKERTLVVYAGTRDLPLARDVEVHVLSFVVNHRRSFFSFKVCCAACSSFFSLSSLFFLLLFFSSSSSSSSSSSVLFLFSKSKMKLPPPPERKSWKLSINIMHKVY